MNTTSIILVSWIASSWKVILDKILSYNLIPQTYQHFLTIFWCNFNLKTILTDAIDFVLLRETLQRLKEGKKVEVPIYNFVSHRRETKSFSMYGADVLIFEGILAFHMPDIVDMLDIKVSLGF